MCFLLFQAEDGIRDLVRSRGLGDVYKRQDFSGEALSVAGLADLLQDHEVKLGALIGDKLREACLLYTSDAADERSSVDLGGRRILKKKNNGNRGSEEK